MFEFSNGGSRIREIREPVVKDGKLSVEVVGKEDFQDYIESFSDQVDLENIVARAMNGDTEALNQRIGSYGDFTTFPKTYAEALQRIIDAKNLFDSLPVSVRNNFENDVYKFVSSLDEPDFLDKIGYVKPTDVEVKDGVAE